MAGEGHYSRTGSPVWAESGMTFELDTPHGQMMAGMA